MEINTPPGKREGDKKRQHPNNGGQENQQDLTNEVASETTMPDTETISECTEEVCNEDKDQYKLGNVRGATVSCTTNAQNSRYIR